MKVKISTQIGTASYQFEVEEEEVFDALFKAAPFSNIPKECGKCGSENVVMSGNMAKGYQFVKMICQDCNARAAAGQYQAEDGIFWKEWKTREEEMNGSNSNQNQQGAPQPGSQQARQQANQEAQIAQQEDSPGNAPQGKADNVPVGE